MESSRIEFKRELSSSLEREVVAFPMDPAALRLAQEEKKTSEKTLGKTSGKILDLMRENKNISIPEIAENLERSQRAIEMQINQLKARDLLRRVGPAKGGHWEVLEK